jgi:hypothetical protein
LGEYSGLRDGTDLPGWETAVIRLFPNPLLNFGS